jgi:hypothetical protein
MKIKYNKRILKAYRNLGIFLLILSIFSISINMIEDNSLHWTDFGYPLMALFYLVYYVYINQNPYLKIENGVISFSDPFNKDISLSEITQIKKFAGDIKIIVNEKETIISKGLADENSIEKLESYLNELNLYKIKEINTIHSV